MELLCCSGSHCNVYDLGCSDCPCEKDGGNSDKFCRSDFSSDINGRSNIDFLSNIDCITEELDHSNFSSNLDCKIDELARSELLTVLEGNIEELYCSDVISDNIISLECKNGSACLDLRDA